MINDPDWLWVLGSLGYKQWALYSQHLSTVLEIAQRLHKCISISIYLGLGPGQVSPDSRINHVAIMLWQQFFPTIPHHLPTYTYINCIQFLLGVAV